MSSRHQTPDTMLKGCDVSKEFANSQIAPVPCCCATFANISRVIDCAKGDIAPVALEFEPTICRLARAVIALQPIMRLLSMPSGCCGAKLQIVITGSFREPKLWCLS